MAKELKLKEIHVEIEPGVTLIAELNSVAEVNEVIAALRDAKLLGVTSSRSGNLSGAEAKLGDDPQSLVEDQSGLPSGSLKTNRILAFKDGVPQLLRTNKFDSVTEAVVVLLYGIEIGLRRPRTSYDDFKALYESQSLKSGSSLSLLVNNLKNDGYIDKRQYDADRQVSLTAKGAQKAVEVLQQMVKTQE